MLSHLPYVGRHIELLFEISMMGWLLCPKLTLLQTDFTEMRHLGLINSCN